MKIIETKCPGCGASMSFNSDQKELKCDFCGKALIVDDETQNLKIGNAEELGYQFEKGKQRAQSERTTTYYSPEPPKKKRKTWLWILGWIFIFPVPLMLVLKDKEKPSKKVKLIITIAAWVVYVLWIVIAMVANGNNENRSTIVETTVTTEAQETTTIETTEETTVEPTTEEPTEAPTKAPTETPTEAQAENPIVFTNYTNYVEAGSNATVTIQGEPNTDYKIHVYYDNGESTAQGLEPKTSDANGVVTWEWKVGVNTTPGTHAITVEGGGTKNSVQFEVLEEIN